MATDTVDGMSSHMRGLTVTTLAAVAGLAAGVLSNQVTGGVATDNVALGVLAAAVLVQLPLLRVLGVDVGEFSTKDYLFVTFMTFSMWFVSWGILMTSARF